MKVFNQYCYFRFVLRMIALFIVIILTSHLPSWADSEGAEKELLTKAKEFIDQEKYERAIPYLEQVYNITKDEGIKLKLVETYERAASALSESGRTNQALALLEKSKQISATVDVNKIKNVDSSSSSTNPELIHAKQFITDGNSGSSEQALADARSRVLFEGALKSFEQKQYGLARGMLQEGIRYNDKNNLAFELLGDIEYYSQNLAAAKSAYESSYKLNKTDRVLEKINKLSSETKLNTDLAEYLDEHFIIRYKRKEEFEGSEIREYLRDAYRVISRDLGHYLNFKTVVILYGKKDYESISAIPHWSGALFDGKIRIPAYDSKMTKDRLRKLIQHELSHVFISDLSKDHCPVWLHEGIAEYEENKIIPINTQLYNMALLSKNLYSPEDLQKGVIDEKDDLKAHVFYQQSFVIVRALADQFKFLGIKKLLQKLGTDMSFDDAFKEIFLTNFSDYVLKLQAQNESKIKRT